MICIRVRAGVRDEKMFRKQIDTGTDPDQDEKLLTTFSAPKVSFYPK
jgi:hypothetical protein